jgi:prepilin-type N-terminal cleavage/methylation domain-containing protein
MLNKLVMANKNQKGFTLIELIIAVAISGLIIGSIAMAITQIFIGHAQSSGEMTALLQVQNVGYWINRDGPMAEKIEPAITDDPDTPEEGGTDVLVMYYTQYTSWVTDEEGTAILSIKHKVTYYLTDEGQLLRYHHTTEEGSHTPGFPTIDSFPNEPDYDPAVIHVADFISVVEFIDNKLTVTATTGGFNSQSETRTYEIDPRPDEIN